MPAFWTVQIIKNKSPQDHVKNREKYAQYFQCNKISPIPELVQEVQQKIISFVVTDLKTRKLAGLRKDTFEELLKLNTIADAVSPPGISCCFRKN